MSKKSKFTDKRGTITDLLVTPEYSVTHITFTKDAIRGNHYHEKTTQHDFILGGNLIVKIGDKEYVATKGSMVSIPLSMPHAYKATEPSEMLSICFGVRRGQDYEKDVIRLKEPLI